MEVIKISLMLSQFNLIFLLQILQHNNKNLKQLSMFLYSLLDAPVEVFHEQGGKRLALPTGSNKTSQLQPCAQPVFC